MGDKNSLLKFIAGTLVLTTFGVGLAKSCVDNHYN